MFFPRNAKSLFLFAVLAFVALVMVSRFTPVMRERSGSAQAIDGDSLRLNGEEIRLEGIDAPELRQTCERQGRSVACGREAKRFLENLIGQGKVSCQPTGIDRYDRILARCMVAGQSINALMVQEGMAIAYGDYETQEHAAKAAKRGLWAGFFETPSAWRTQHPHPRAP